MKLLFTDIFYHFVYCPCTPTLESWDRVSCFLRIFPWLLFCSQRVSVLLCSEFYDFLFFNSSWFCKLELHFWFFFFLNFDIGLGPEERCIKRCFHLSYTAHKETPLNQMNQPFVLEDLDKWSWYCCSGRIFHSNSKV